SNSQPRAVPRVYPTTASRGGQNSADGSGPHNGGEFATSPRYRKAEPTQDSIVSSWTVIPQQPALPGIARSDHLGIEAPFQVRGEVLSHLPAPVVNLEQVAHLVGRAVVAPAVPQVAAKEQDIPGLTQNRLRQPAIPVLLAPSRLPASTMAARDDMG